MMTNVMTDVVWYVDCVFCVTISIVMCDYFLCDMVMPRMITRGNGVINDYYDYYYDDYGDDNHDYNDNYFDDYNDGDYSDDDYDDNYDM